MELTLRTYGSALVLAAAGRIDQHSADAFQAALAPHLAGCTRDGAPLVLDFSGVDYLSSVGLRVLMLAARQVTAQNGRIAIAALQPLVNEVFEISRFNLVFKVFGDVETAVGALS